MTIAKYEGQNLELFMKTSYNDLVNFINTDKGFSLKDNIYYGLFTLPQNTDVMISHNLNKRIIFGAILSLDSVYNLINNPEFIIKNLPKNGTLNKNSVLLYNTSASYTGLHLVFLIGV